MNKYNSWKKFEKEFPKAARVASCSPGADIIYNDKAFWLNGEVQLTGWKIGNDGKAMSHDDNENIAVERIREFRTNREALEKESLVVRFKRLIKEAESIERKYKHFSTYRHLGGDKATVLDDGDVWITFTGIDYQISATGKKNRSEAITECIKQFEAYTGAKI